MFIVGTINTDVISGAVGVLIAAAIIIMELRNM